MALTAAQKTTLKAHLTANTDTVINIVNGQAAAINTLLGAPFNTDNLQRIADWYNTLAAGSEAQSLGNRNLWNPKTTIAQLNTAIRWQDLIPHDLGGSPTVDQQMLARNEKWMRWQSMTWNQNQGLDMTDSQVRQGVLAIFGDVAAASSAASIGGTSCGKINGKRLEIVLSGGAVGAATNAWTAARLCPSNILGQTISEPEIEDLLLNG